MLIGFCFACIHLRDALQLKRASRSRTKTGVFLVFFHLFLKVFWSRNGSKLDFNFELSWRSSWEASWSDVGRFLGGQDAPKTAQDGAKTAQDGAKMAQDGQMELLICLS